MMTLPITEQSKQQEWKIILTIARNNGLSIPKIIQQNKKWITFTYDSPLIRRVTNLFRKTSLNIAF
jgi:hypothetical protein